MPYEYNGKILYVELTDGHCEVRTLEGVMLGSDGRYATMKAGAIHVE